MFQALFFKEWVKLRLWWSLLAAANFAFAAYLALQLRAVGTLYDASMIWSSWIYKAYLFCGAYQFVPLGLGLTLGVLQFFPEVQQQRIRLVLHLPLGEERAVALHLLAGLVLLSLLVLPAAAAFAGVGALYLPREFQLNFLLTASPWLLAGYAGYLLAAAALLEANWFNRAVLVLLGAGALRLFFQEPFYEGYRRLLPALLLWVGWLVSLPLFSSHRFRKGLNR